MNSRRRLQANGNTAYEYKMNNGSAEHHDDQALLSRTLHFCGGKGVLEARVKVVCNFVSLCLCMSPKGLGG